MLDKIVALDTLPMAEADLTYMHLCRVFCCPLKLRCRTGILFHAFAQMIERLSEAAQITAQSRAEVGQGQVICMPTTEFRNSPELPTPRAEIVGHNSIGPQLAEFRVHSPIVRVDGLYRNKSLDAIHCRY